MYIIKIYSMVPISPRRHMLPPYHSLMGHFKIHGSPHCIRITAGGAALYGYQRLLNTPRPPASQPAPPSLPRVGLESSNSRSPARPHTRLALYGNHATRRRLPLTRFYHSLKGKRKGKGKGRGKERGGRCREGEQEREGKEQEEKEGEKEMGRKEKGKGGEKVTAMM